jgi:nucleoside phosphorylase
MSVIIVTQQIMTKFPKIIYIFLIGIAGSVPSDKNNIYLGNIIISFLYGKYGRVIQYDFRKDKE